MGADILKNDAASSRPKPVETLKTQHTRAE
jgi:hypothetical protein